MSRRVGVVGIFTLLSRILGLVRDAVMAWAFGATRIADAFYVAFRIPNLLRRLVAEGALTIAFIPVFTEYLHNSRDEAKKAASVIFTYLSLFLAALVVAGVVFAPVIVKLIAWGFGYDDEKFRMTVYLTRLMFPYIALISLVALAMGILNTLKRFAAPAASPILLNIGIICGAWFLWKFFEMPATGLAVGVLIGGVAQLALQIPFLMREGMLPKLNFDWRHPALKGMLFLMIPSAFGAAVYQLNVVVVTLLASFLPEGSVSYLWYADRISEFSLGIFSISVATVALPVLAGHVVSKDMDALKRTENFSLRLAMFIDIPSAIGLYLLSLPIVAVLLQRGEFDPITAARTAAALSIFALKLPFVSGVRNLVPAFFALRDAKTPVYVSAATVVVNAAAALLLMGKYKHVGLAMALVISSVFNFSLLLYLLRRKIGPIGGAKLISSAVRTCIASAAMAICLMIIIKLVGPNWYAVLWRKVMILSSFIIIGFSIFLGTSKFLLPEEYKAFLGVLHQKKKREVSVEIKTPLDVK